MARSPDPREILERLLAALERDDDDAAMTAIREGYEIFNTTGAEGWLPAFATDIEWTQGSDALEPQVFHGHEGVLQQQRLVMDAWESFRFEPTAFRAAEGVLVVTVDASARGVASGIEVQTRMAHLWRHRDGLISRFEIFIDPERALASIS